MLDVVARSSRQRTTTKYDRYDSTVLLTVVVLVVFGEVQQSTKARLAYGVILACLHTPYWKLCYGLILTGNSVTCSYTHTIHTYIHELYMVSCLCNAVKLGDNREIVL